MVLTVVLLSLGIKGLVLQDQSNQIDDLPIVTDTKDSIVESKNDMRIEYIQEIQFEIERFYFEFDEYPSSIELGDQKGLKLFSKTSVVESNTPVKTLVPSHFVCYKLINNQYKLGIKLEDLSWYDVGTSEENCEETDIVVSN
jgi:hypothetical protein